jgi:hypothetical protein
MEANLILSHCIVSEDRTMNDDLLQLRTILQMLALPVVGQLRLVGDDCARPGVLAHAFSVTHQAVNSQVGTQLVPEQASALARLDQQLARVRRESSLPVCSELTMRKSSDWRQVRSLAREALVHFKWTLDVPQQVLRPPLHSWDLEVDGVRPV